jgi:hypothetical protein
VRERLYGRRGTGGPRGRFSSGARELALAQSGAGMRVPSELAACGTAQRWCKQARERRCAAAERAAQRARVAAAVRVAQEHGRVSAGTAQVRRERTRGGVQELVERDMAVRVGADDAGCGSAQFDRATV